MIALDKYADKLQKVTKVWRDEQDRVRLDKNMSAGEKRLKLKELEAQESNCTMNIWRYSKLRNLRLSAKLMTINLINIFRDYRRNTYA